MADNKSTAGGRPRSGGDRGGVGGLVGAGPSIVGVSGAMRARDVSRPTTDDVRAAGQSVVVKRRNWEPPQGGEPSPAPARRPVPAPSDVIPPSTRRDPQLPPD